MKLAMRSSLVLAVLAGLLAVVVLAAPAQKQQPAKPTAAAIQVLLVNSDEVKLPAEFQMAIYENLLATLQKTGKFSQIYRDGDRRAEGVADLLTLRTNVRGFKQGSARARQVTTVAGATSIKVNVQITDHDGKVLLNRDVEGKVHFFGENIRATYNLAKAVAKVINDSFQTPSASAKAN